MPRCPVVDTPRLTPLGLVPLALAMLVVLAPPAGLRAQDQQHGKIKDVERSADNATKGKGHHDHGDHDDDGGGFFFGLLRFFFHHGQAAAQTTASDTTSPPPEPPSQGYLAYPYAHPSALGSFVLQNVTTGREFGNVSATYFRDDGSTLRSGQFALDAAYANLLFSAEYDYYREPLPEGTDYLHLGRFGLDGVGRVGDIGYFKAGLALQMAFTDDGHEAGGPELDAGLQLFPIRPIGVGATARFAALTWHGGPLFGTGFADLAGNGSVFIGRVELQAGYRWTRVGIGAPFHGPVLGMRVWF